ncbi:hypothetical protein PUNSTDRAFT_135043 [Punctularia strigosozonata HHB-11173 SS5]|uniref:uncharacterized protein n=1 Tax=Punctularia strigosozonata (strain HHB-11173) TaxID=741275 RepID=UPI0004417FE7|nr:uncharacterized protein PUNSTDRAFT_135043 [Punctularia strigosozonata HHB-11173 SS5]EIN08664.1 hypothetical protein PUNSTDRAFT_135043 [Punctularia strigosozonata HHB-11173 SS5]
MDTYDSWAHRGPVVVATLALGYGINIGHIRDVFMYGLPSHALVAKQEAGHAGRDGRAVQIWFLDQKDIYQVREDHDALLGATKFISCVCKGDCIRHFFHEFFDGEKKTCIDIPNTELCSRCKKLCQQDYPEELPTAVLP